MAHNAEICKCADSGKRPAVANSVLDSACRSKVIFR